MNYYWKLFGPGFDTGTSTIKKDSPLENVEDILFRFKVELEFNEDKTAILIKSLEADRIYTIIGDYMLDLNDIICWYLPKQILNKEFVEEMEKIKNLFVEYIRSQDEE